MWQVAAALVQIIYLILKNKFEKDEAERKRKEVLYAEVKEIVKSGDAGRINDLILRLRG